MSLPAPLKSRLRLPLIAAPMFLVSGPALVKAACRAGVIGSFPTANCRTVEELDRWLAHTGDDLPRPAHWTRRAGRAALPHPDRASFQHARAGCPCRRAAPQGGDGHHQRRLARAGAEALEG